jgi:hypothetical protein
MLPVIYKLDKDRELKLTFRAVARIEEVFGKAIFKIDLKTLLFKDVANILAEAMRHEDKDISADKVMDLIELYSNKAEPFTKVYACINEAFGMSKGSESEGEQIAPVETKTSGTGA